MQTVMNFSVYLTVKLWKGIFTQLWDLTFDRSKQNRYEFKNYINGYISGHTSDPSSGLTNKNLNKNSTREKHFKILKTTY